VTGRPGEAPAAAAVIVFDGTCGFCEFSVTTLARRLRLPGQLRPAGSLDLAALGLTFEQARERMWFVSGDVRRGGCAAFAAWLRTGHGLAAALGLALQLPAVAWLGERVYGWVAARRHRIPGPWRHTCRV
jgi:predicted DCC family thiol-disulfide oxidoreductase YuxK